MASPRKRQEPEPIRITTAPQNSNDDLESRRRRYLFSMSLRTICFVAAILVGDVWFRWVLILGAVFLPYIAVVVANTASPRIEGADLVSSRNKYRELE